MPESNTAPESTVSESTAASPTTASEDVFDVIVIGAGPVGENVADRARAAGLTVALIESELVGGECSYWACMPSKALLRPVAALAEARAVAGSREAVTGKLDAAAVFARRDEFTSHWKDDGQAGWVDSIGAVLVRGHGRLAGPRRVEVDTPDGGVRRLAARHAVAVCTGSDALIPDLPGVAQAKPWTSRQATSGRDVERLVIVGGGVVGVEMATAWRALGAEVTLLIREAAPLPRMEPFVGEMIASSLSEAGVKVRTGVTVTGLDRPTQGGPVSVLLADGQKIEGDEVLLAVGRTPRTKHLGLETVGLETGSWLKVDDSCRVQGVDGDWLFAVGDVNHRALLTHQGKYQARIAGTVIGALARGEALDMQRWSPHVATADIDAVPQVVFTEPEVGSVGKTADEARRAGLNVRVVDYDLGQVAGASLFADGYRGRARMVVDLDRNVLLGVTFIGSGVAELVHSATVAVAGEVPIDRLWHAVPSYPTISEVWLRLLETLRG
ncbi:MAG TPA: NAD(P)/FAD-dependent oxidoreductase [Actinocrinis sp.]|nr:NAD(P)/FAD-dependent oxidoreductase [Actinocrinis sp.]HZU57851.1 NAD(P)/FAD-dependent oxidoreductase [Actinocrinis sp.]